MKPRMCPRSHTTPEPPTAHPGETGNIVRALRETHIKSSPDHAPNSLTRSHPPPMTALLPPNSSASPRPCASTFPDHGEVQRRPLVIHANIRPARRISPFTVSVEDETCRAAGGLSSGRTAGIFAVLEGMGPRRLCFVAPHALSLAKRTCPCIPVRVISLTCPRPNA